MGAAGRELERDGDATGTVLERYVYDPYGQPTVLTPTWGERSSSDYGWVYLHQGGRYDGEVGLYHFRHRDYSPTLGRWLNLDPIGFDAGDSNLYRYVGNGPTNATDPIGLSDGMQAHHPYPLFLGGDDAGQSLFELTFEQQRKCNAVFRKHGIPQNEHWKNDVHRATWKALGVEKQRAIIIESLQAAGVPDSLINQHIDKIMEKAVPGENHYTSKRASIKGRVISNAAIQEAARLASNSGAGAPPAGGGGRMVARGLAVLNVYLTFRDALVASGVTKPEFVEITADYYFVETDNSVFVVEVPGSLNFWSDRKKKFIAGPRAGESEVITKQDVAKYQAVAEAKFGRYISGGLFRDPRFIPGTHRKTLPLIDADTNAKIGYIDEEGVHYYRMPGPARY